MTQPKSTAQLKSQGTFRRDRHGGRADADYQGEPCQPKGRAAPKLDANGRWLWKQIVDHTPPNVLAAIDTASLVAACEWWSMWRDATDAHRENPGDWKAACKAGMAWKHVSSLLSKFGCSPVDRTRIKSTAEQETTDPLQDFFRESLN